MKKINYICFAIGILISLYIFIYINNLWDFINTFIIYVILPMGVKKADDKKRLARITFFTTWVTIYNIIYVILISFSNIDLLNVKWRYFVQLFIPIIIITINKFSQEDKSLS